MESILLWDKQESSHGLSGTVFSADSYSAWYKDSISLHRTSRRSNIGSSIGALLWLPFVVAGAISASVAAIVSFGRKLGFGFSVLLPQAYSPIISAKRTTVILRYFMNLDSFFSEFSNGFFCNRDDAEVFPIADGEVGIHTDSFPIE